MARYSIVGAGKLAFVNASRKKGQRDVNANVHRIFDEMIERSAEPPKRGNLKRAPQPKNTPKKK